MQAQLDPILWQRSRTARQRQSRMGRLSALFLGLAFIVLLDGLQASMRTDGQQLDMLPGQTEQLSGPSALKNPLPADVQVRITPENAPLQFTLQDFYAGYWFGNGMWRGTLHAQDTARPGRYTLGVRFKGSSAQAQYFTIQLWEDAAALRRASPSHFYGFTGQSPYRLAGLLLGVGVLFGMATYWQGRTFLQALRGMGCSEIFRLQQEDGQLRAFCLSQGRKLRCPGAVCAVLDSQGQPLTQARCDLLQKNILQLLLPQDSRVCVGCLVVLQPSGPQKTGAQDTSAAVA